MASIVVSALERKVQALQQELERVRSGLHQQMHQEIEKTKAALRSELDEKIERVRAELRQAADTSAQVSPVISTPEKQNGSDELEEPQEDCSVLKFLESLGAPFVDAFRGSKNK
ncbi:hypothetical protein LM597_00135 [Candidatus Acetothermia bacterium]|nr:hypothetical protein [Candidatus Acetothermia bacterium]